MGGIDRRDRLLWWSAVSAIALIGLALRIIAARGGLWTDEAWSVIYAAQARDAIGVFLRINHDNNHHLNSLWLQAIGPAAPPILARVPSIAAGTLCIIVAALFGRRRSLAAGIVAALLFAIAPMLLAFGSEARGYAMMLLAALTMLLIVGDAIDGRPLRGAPAWLAPVAVLGMFSHLTMVAAVAIATLWAYLEWRADRGADAAMRATLKLMAPAITGTALVIAFVFAAAALSPTGLRVGGYNPFSARLFAGALNDVALWSIGLGARWPWLVPICLGLLALVLLARPPQWLGSRARLYALLIIVVPAGILAVQAGNSSFPRYYLTSGIGLLLLLSESIARGLGGRPVMRVAAAALVAALIAVSAYRDHLLIQEDRGRPDAALADMAALLPGGARIAFPEPRLKGVVAVAAERTGYRARFAGGCSPADFLLASRDMAPTPRTIERCGVPMDAIDSSTTSPLTGDAWILYRPRKLAKPQGR
jgi:hypothetical protein